MLWVIANTHAQFEHWCRFRGWSPRDRGIRFLHAGRVESFAGIYFEPGDLVIQCEPFADEHYGYRYRDAQQEFLYRKAKSEAVGFRYDPTMPREIEEQYEEARNSR